MLSRRSILLGIGAAAVTPAAALAQAAMPSEAQIQQRLEAAPTMRVAPNQRVTIEQFKRRSELRRARAFNRYPGDQFRVQLGTHSDLPVSQGGSHCACAQQAASAAAGHHHSFGRAHGCSWVGFLQSATFRTASPLTASAACEAVRNTGAHAGDRGLWRALSFDQHALRRLAEPKGHPSSYRRFHPLVCRHKKGPPDGSGGPRVVKLNRVRRR